MTSLNPSHIPSHRLNEHSRRNAQAVHTSIAAPSQAAREALEKQGDSEAIQEYDHADSDTESEDDVRTRLDAKLDERERRERARKIFEKRRGRIPAPPIPDLRFEQGVLLSLRPYLHSANPTSTTATTSTTNKRRRIEAEERKAFVSSAFTVEGAKRGDDNDLFSGKLTVEWSRVAYILFRDQLLFPLLQGIAWSIGGLGLSALWKWQGIRKPSSSQSHQRPASKLFGSRAAPLRR